MQEVQTLAIALCVFSFAGLAVYVADIVNLIPDDLIQQAEAIRRSTHQCTSPILGGCL
jgi:hypothetical protein